MAKDKTWPLPSKALFERQRGRRRVEDGADLDALYGQIGRLQVQVEWLKNKVGTKPAAVRREYAQTILP